MRTRHALIVLCSLILGCAPLGRSLVQAEPRSGSLSELFNRVNPAVVEVAGIQAGRGQSGGQRSLLGSGVVISREGEVLTSHHIVEAAERIMVRFLDGRTAEAALLASSAQADLALLQIRQPPEDLAVAGLGDSDTARVGDRIFVIGAPYGIRHTMTVGYISGRRQSQAPCPSMTPFEYLQTDAAINQGNSGGPMLDSEGRIIGIVSRILSRSGGSEGLGFAVGINTAKRLLLEEGSVWIGFDAALVSGILAEALNLPQEAGLLVQKVARGSPAAAMGLKAGELEARIGDRKLRLGGDVILSIQGTAIRPSVENICALNNVIGGFSAETEIDMTVLRQGRTLRLKSGP